ncbi:MAM and LDL-receptor class A domain-containing protein 1-like [Branchiostoma floridae]|uniref:MAM and LDL-receptor class A domain-containing protein 1-like n=1 Tax=Branchiostoma floridae TaxID=7739 RepID=A0A9J7HEC2_BRAFL|nr:MAM and LDL-receptor class A domain-containing protein 1-like [Branchiostoma floridae]
METTHVVVCLILLTVSTVVRAQSCGFDTLDFCGWTQATDDELDWLINEGPTSARLFAQAFGRPELGTGPVADHTLGDDRGGYATIPHTGHSDGDRARLVSQEYTVDVVLRFWYHLFGQNIFLNVYLDKGGTLNPIFQDYESASTDDTWKLKVLSIVASGPYKIVFETGRDGSFRCQAAIDDVDIIMCGGVCEIPPEPHLDCTFDRDMCGFHQDNNDDIDWTRHMRATPNRVYAVQHSAPEAKTGPFHDHTQGPHHNGYYMYIESSTPAQTGDVARLFSPETSGPCLEFYFHMFGPQMGTLQVYTRLSGSTDTQLQWELSGDRGDTWNRAIINHNITDNYQPHRFS